MKNKHCKRCRIIIPHPSVLILLYLVKQVGRAAKARAKSRKKYLSSPAIGPCRHITSPTGMAEFLESRKGKDTLSSDWRVLKSMEQQKSKLLVYVDVEKASTVLIEIGIINAANEEIIDTLVTYDTPWRQIYVEGSDAVKLWMDNQKSKFRWNDQWEFPPGTRTMNAHQVADVLQKAGFNHPNAKIIEFTSGNSDSKVVRDFLDHGNNNLGWVLGGHVGFGLITQWRKKLPGFWQYAQHVLFELIHDGHPLASDSHRALIDAKKMHILFQDLVLDSAAN